MGSPASEDCREHYGKKETAHQVTLTHDFEISATEEVSRNRVTDTDRATRGGAAAWRPGGRWRERCYRAELVSAEGADVGAWGSVWS